jgi:hypothetical protein
MRTVAVTLLALSGSAVAAPKSEPARLELVAVDGIASNRGLIELPDSLAAGRERAAEIAACARSMVIDVSDPISSVAFSVYLLVGEDGNVAKVELQRDPSTGIVHRAPSQAMKCVGRVVKGWTFPDHDNVMLRFVLVRPVSRDPRVPDAYVQALTAVCDAVPEGSNAGVSEQAELIRAALASHPNAALKKLLASVGGQTPATRDSVVRAIIASAGRSTCRSLGL